MPQKSKKRLKDSRKRIEDNVSSTLPTTESDVSQNTKRKHKLPYNRKGDSNIEKELDIDSDHDLEPALDINDIKVPSLENVDQDIRKYIDNLLYISTESSLRYIKKIDEQKHELDYYRKLHGEKKYRAYQKNKNVEKKNVSTNKSTTGKELLKENKKVLQIGSDIEKAVTSQTSKQNSFTRDMNDKDRNTSKDVTIVNKDDKNNIQKTRFNNNKPGKYTKKPKPVKPASQTEEPITGINGKTVKYEKRPNATKPSSDSKEPTRVREKSSAPTKNMQPKENKDNSRLPPLDSRSSSSSSSFYSSSYTSASYELIEEDIDSGSPRRLVGVSQPYSRTQSPVGNASFAEGHVLVLKSSLKSPHKKEEADVKSSGDVNIQMEAMSSTEVNYIHNQDLTQRIIRRVRDPQKNFTLPQIRSSPSVDSRDSPMKPERKVKNVRVAALPNMMTIIPASDATPTPPSTPCRIRRPKTGKPKFCKVEDVMSESLSDMSLL